MLRVFSLSLMKFVCCVKKFRLFWFFMSVSRKKFRNKWIVLWYKLRMKWL